MDSEIEFRYRRLKPRHRFVQRIDGVASPESFAGLMETRPSTSLYRWPQPLLDDRYATFADLLDAAAEAFPGQQAYVEGAHTMTYREWRDSAERLGAALVKSGVGPADVILISLEASIDYAVCFAAAQYIGAIPSGINPRLGPHEVGAILHRSQPRLLIVEDSVELVPSAPRTIRRSELTQLSRHAPALMQPPRPKSSDPAVIIWTSGTTGLAKGAWFDHANLKAAVRTCGPLGGPWVRRLNSTPFTHAGYMSKVWEQVAFGMTTVISGSPWTAAEMLRLLIEERINVAGGVPTQWEKLILLPGIETRRLPHLQIGITSTAPASPQLIERVTRILGCPLIVRYALTECPSLSGTRPGDTAEVLYRTVGRPQPDTLIELADDTGEPVAQGMVGRLRVRSPLVMRGYWRDPEKTAEALSSDGWLLTGDYARLDPEGNIILAGRVNEMYIRGGYNIYPIEVERVLQEHPSVAGAAVLGRSAPVIGEIGVAFVVPSDFSAPPRLDELRAWVRSKLADYKAPDELVVLEKLPLTAMMKIDKQALRARLPAAH
jgi:acyl-CoA synthetase (AMP-forming)/AMP-acid ligase II